MRKHNNDLAGFSSIELCQIAKQRLDSAELQLGASSYRKHPNPDAALVEARDAMRHVAELVERLEVECSKSFVERFKATMHMLRQASPELVEDAEQAS